MANKVTLNSPWLGAEQDFMDALSQDPSMTADQRLMWLVLAHMNDRGHASFREGEVRKAMGTVNESTGELTVLSERQLRRAKNLLIKRQILAEDQLGGGELCFIVSHHFDRSYRPAKRCVHDGPKPRRDRSAVAPKATARVLSTSELADVPCPF